MIEGNEGVDWNDEDVKHVTEIVNRMTIEELYDYLHATESLPQLAWLSTAVDNMEREIHILYALAYADARGELKELKLQVPETTEDDADEG